MLLVSNIRNEHTYVPNAFIDKFLPIANGEFIKVYLLLLRLNGIESVSVAGIADMLDMTEKDVLRAITYWEKQGLLELGYEGEKLTRLLILDSGSAEKVTDKTGEVKTMPMRASANESAPAEKKPSPAQPADPADKEFSAMIYVCERYLERHLTRTDTELYTYLYNELHFPVDLVEYLTEYCVGAGHKNAAYIRKVALNWSQEGVKDVPGAMAQVKEFADKSKKKTGTQNKFNNFEQREDDLNALLGKGKKDGTK